MLSCRHDPPQPEQCHICLLWVSDPRYRLKWGGDSRDILPSRATRDPDAPPGPGTKLKQRISELGIPTEGCGSCGDIAGEMDRNGDEWCLTNITSLVDRIIANLEKRGYTGTLLNALKASPLATIKLAFGGLSVRGVIEKMIREACAVADSA